eukprot:4418832-Ditylum_brightwellii.AAC.1
MHTQGGIDGIQEVVGWGDSTTELPPPSLLCENDPPPILNTNDPPPVLNINDPPPILNMNDVQEMVGWGDSTTELPPPPPLHKNDPLNPTLKQKTNTNYVPPHVAPLFASVSAINE